MKTNMKTTLVGIAVAALAVACAGRAAADGMTWTAADKGLRCTAFEPLFQNVSLDDVEPVAVVGSSGIAPRALKSGPCVLNVVRGEDGGAKWLKFEVQGLVKNDKMVRGLYAALRQNGADIEGKVLKVGYWNAADVGKFRSAMFVSSPGAEGCAYAPGVKAYAKVWSPDGDPKFGFGIESITLGPKGSAPAAKPAPSTSVASDDIAKFDSNMAVDTAVHGEGMKWIDGRELPIEGRAFDDVEHYYDRLPANVTEAVNGGVRNMKHHTAGMQFRFSTTSRRLVFKWVPYSKLPNRDTFPNSGTSGIDVYRYNKRLGRWVFAATGRIEKSEGGVLEVKWWPEDDCLVNLPLYNGIRSFSLGIEEDATVSPLPPRRSGIVKPVVFYGTSITHGACASRPGMSFPNIIGRELDVPIVNLGFSGSGRMELEMSDHVASIDASCYLIDSLANMASKNQKRGNYPFVEDRYEPFIRNLRAKRPDAPIIMCGEPDAWCRKHQMEKYAEELYRKLIAEGWKNLYFISTDNMLPKDFEGTVEGRHPNDYGMMFLARGYGAAVKEALGL